MKNLTRNSILKLEKVCKDFGGLHAVDYCSFEVEENSITGLIGPNGAGKTTTFDIIAGLIEPTSGKVFFKDQDVTDVPAYKRARLGLAHTFQLIRLFPELTAIDNLLVVLQKNFQKLHHVFFSNKKELARLKEEAHALLAEVGLESHAYTYAKNLSYGQQKLLEIIRAVATNADLYLLDEPAAGVNPTMLRHIEKIIRTLAARGKTILVVEHNMPFVMGLCEKIIVLDQGAHLTEGPPDEIQKNPRVLEAYLGKRRITMKT